MQYKTVSLSYELMQVSNIVFLHAFSMIGGWLEAIISI